MKKFFFPAAILAALFVIAGCSEKFKIAAPYKNITVVDGFLDQSDTAHYIRIQKAFMDENKSALTMSQSPDSSFYANLDVKIKRISLSVGVVVDTIHLNRVDLDLEGYPKQAGVFFNSPNYAYKFKGLLDPNYTYRLCITNLATGEVDSSDAPIIIDNDSTEFAVDALVSPYNQQVLNFGGTGTNEKDFSVYVAYGATGTNYPVPTVFDMVLRFNWYDSNYVTKTLTARYYDYDMGYQQFQNGHETFSPLNNDIYNAIFAGMGIAPANTIRLLNRCDLFVYLSTTDFANYQAAIQSQGLGLTGSEVEPIYTNIKGANTIGLYTSKGVRTGKLTIVPATVDSLIASTYLAPVNIKGTRY